MLHEQHLERLRELYPVVEQVEPRLLQRVLAKARVVSLPAGATVFEELQACSAFPFILAGELRVFKRSASGRELSLYTVTPGDACVVSTGCLLGDAPYKASGQVLHDAVVLLMPAADFEQLMSSPPFREFVFSLFSKRITELMQLIEEVAFHRLDRRLAALLLRRATPVSVSHQELADGLGTVREMVSRVLKGFADAGLLRLGRERIEILDEPGLRRVAGE